MKKLNNKLVLIGCFKSDNIYSMEIYLQEVEKELKNTDTPFITIRPPEPFTLSKIPHKLKQIYRYLSLYIILPLKLVFIRNNYNHFHIIDHTYSYLAIILGKKCTITCHDLYSYHTNEKRSLFGKIDKLLFKWSTKQMIHSNQIISVSKYTGKDIIETLGVSESLITVSHEGINSSIKFTNTVPADINNDCIKIIHVGSNDPRKNIELIFNVIHILQNKNIPVQLIKVGAPFSNQQKNIITKLSINQSILHKGFLTNEELSKYYSSSDILLFPSTFEGFGFPIIEAMRCKCAVIALNGSSITELIKETGIGIDENNANEFIKVIENFINNPKLLKSQKEKSEVFSRKFHWHYHVNEIVKSGY